MSVFKRLFVAASLWILAAYSGSAKSVDDWVKELTPIVSNQAHVRFIAEEAARARVSKISVIPSSEMRSVCSSAGIHSYGCALKKNGRYLIYLNKDKRGALGVVNLTHEIAHVAMFRKNCYYHGDRWLEYLMDVAKRFETEFPGQKWGSYTPTGSVEVKYRRYGRERNLCKTKNSVKHELNVSAVRLILSGRYGNVPVSKLKIRASKSDPKTRKSKWMLHESLVHLGNRTYGFDFDTRAKQNALKKSDTICVGFTPESGVKIPGGGTGVCYTPHTPERNSSGGTNVVDPKTGILTITIK